MNANFLSPPVHFRPCFSCPADYLPAFLELIDLFGQSFGFGIRTKSPCFAVTRFFPSDGQSGLLDMISRMQSGSASLDDLKLLCNVIENAYSGGHALPNRLSLVFDLMKAISELDTFVDFLASDEISAPAHIKGGIKDLLESPFVVLQPVIITNPSLDATDSRGRRIPIALMVAEHIKRVPWARLNNFVSEGMMHNAAYLASLIQRLETNPPFYWLDDAQMIVRLYDDLIVSSAHRKEASQSIKELKRVIDTVSYSPGWIAQHSCRTPMPINFSTKGISKITGIRMGQCVLAASWIVCLYRGAYAFCSYDITRSLSGLFNQTTIYKAFNAVVSSSLVKRDLEIDLPGVSKNGFRITDNLDLIS